MKVCEPEYKRHFFYFYCSFKLKALTFNLMIVCVNTDDYISSPQELPKLLQDLGTTDADLPWNKSKNRFPNIKPCKWSHWKLAFRSYDAFSTLKISLCISINVNWISRLPLVSTTLFSLNCVQTTTTEWSCCQNQALRALTTSTPALSQWVPAISC